MRMFIIYFNYKMLRGKYIISKEHSVGYFYYEVNMATFIISAGHSNVDPGAITNGFCEADIATELRNIIANKMTIMGHTIITDGNVNDNWSLEKALNLLTAGKLAIELHCNSHDNVMATGVESISLDDKKSLAQKLSKAISDTINIKLRGDSGWIDQTQSPRGNLGFVNAGGIIVELFFLTNINDLDKYLANKDSIASAISGVLDKIN